MKLSISALATGYEQLTEVNDECECRSFYEKHKAMKVAAAALGEEWKVSVVRIRGDDVHQDAVRKPLNQEGKKPRTRAPVSQCLVILRVLQHKRLHFALKKQCTKKNKEVAEYDKLLA
ncbi:hypothetical protein U0070_009412 [Myodes glareolus]|uniref:Small ribosomal subunit protein eS6 n=1 Tax=Myodes glareolus TaxID=447135 RepID=A0AAW0I147_MYOGA